MSWRSEGLLGLRAGTPQGLQGGAMIPLCTIWGRQKLGFSRCNKGRTPGPGRLAYRVVHGSGAEARGGGSGPPGGRIVQSAVRTRCSLPRAGICVLSTGTTQAPTHALLDTRSGGETPVTRGVSQGQQLWMMVTSHGVALELRGRSGEEEPRGPRGQARRGRGVAQSRLCGRTELLRQDGLWRRPCAWPPAPRE